MSFWQILIILASSIAAVKVAFDVGKELGRIECTNLDHIPSEEERIKIKKKYKIQGAISQVVDSIIQIFCVGSWLIIGPFLIIAPFVWAWDILSLLGSILNNELGFGFVVGSIILVIFYFYCQRNSSKVE